MGFSNYFSRQAGKPSGWFGRRVMSLVFDKGNTELNGMMKDCMEVKAGDRILEIGCGTGKLICEISQGIDDGCIEGVEFSETMASIAQKRNKKAIANGRVVIHSSDFNTMPLGDNAYDAVCSCNTVYFWPDPLFTLQKIHSILKPAGKMIVAFEDKSRMEKKRISTEVFRFYSSEEFKEMARESGFAGRIEVNEKPGRQAGFCCVVAYK